MIASIIAVALAIALWSLLAVRLERWRINATMVAVVAGMVIGSTTRDSIGETLNTQVAMRAAEIVLAILLFVDATEVRGGPLGRNPAAALRVLLVALPLSLATAVLLGAWLLPGTAWPVLLVIACVVVPIDFAPATAILRDTRIPVRVRNVLNVESGYNDGIVSPIILFALALAGDHSHAETPVDALMTAGPAAVKAIVVGLVVGTVLATLMNRAERANLMNSQSKRVLMVAAPLLAYGVSVGIGGNGFVASFVCGFVFHYARRASEPQRDLELLDDLGLLLTVVMWFVFGSVAVFAVWEGLEWRLVVFCLAAVTIVRLLPVLLSMVGSRLTWVEALLIGCLGPRGTTSIVFGLLAFNVLQRDDDAAGLVLTAMVVTILASIVLHGGGSPLTVRSYRRMTRAR